MPKKVGPSSHLTLHYRIATPEGEIFLSTFGMSPATLQMGEGQLAPPLETCLIGLHAGERFVFQLAPEKAFGPRNPHLLERIARSALPGEIRENTLVEFTAPGGAAFAGFIRELTEQSALVDFNHPLAGKTIRFDVEIIGILDKV